MINHAIGPALLALAALAGAAAAADAPMERRVIFIGGPTLTHWQRVSPGLFNSNPNTLLVAPDGSTASMLKLAQQRLPQGGFDAVMIEPEAGLAGETLAQAEADLAAIVKLARDQGAHGVLAAPLAPGGTPSSPDEGALKAWMQTTAQAQGLVYEGFEAAFTGPLPPMKSWDDLLPRDADVRQALDGSFLVSPGETLAQAMQQRTAAFAATPDTVGSGPYPAVREIDPAFPVATFFRPANLAPFQNHGLPVLIWGNGGCADDSQSARLFLEEVASHGYLVIAPGAMKSGPGGFPHRIDAPDHAPKGRLGVIPAEMTAALDFVTNSPAGAVWRRYVATGKYAVSGHSCGGLLATKLAEDKRIAATMIFSSGVFVDGTVGIPGMSISKSDLALLHTPMLYVMGGSTDVAYPNGTDDYARLPATLPAMLMSREVGHGGTFEQSNGGVYAKVAVAWLDWQLKNDQTAARQFTGSDCGFCGDRNWTIERKGY